MGLAMAAAFSVPSANITFSSSRLFNRLLISPLIGLIIEQDYQLISLKRNTLSA